MLIKVKVWPNWSEDKLIQKGADSFEVWVKAKPRQGQANQAVTRLLVDYLQIEPKQLRLIKGFKQSHKIYELNH